MWNGDISYSEGSYGYVGGRVLTYSNSYEEMYKSERFEKSFEYKIDLERNGKYKVKLYMMENYQSEAGGAAQLLLAAYNKGELIKTAAFDTELRTGVSELPFELPETADTLRLFVWDSNGTPLGRPDIIGIN